MGSIQNLIGEYAREAGEIYEEERRVRQNLPEMHSWIGKPAWQMNPVHREVDIQEVSSGLHYQKRVGGTLLEICGIRVPSTGEVESIVADEFALRLYGTFCGDERDIFSLHGSDSERAAYNSQKVGDRAKEIVPMTPEEIKEFYQIFVQGLNDFGGLLRGHHGYLWNKQAMLAELEKLKGRALESNARDWEQHKREPVIINAPIMTGMKMQGNSSSQIDPIDLIGVGEETFPEA